MRNSTPTHKDIRYDRQLRLWGDHGQKCLEASHIAMIHVNATGSEVLKNLILPGVGQFTVIDSETVSEDDVGRNFFLTSDSVGAPRARAVVELLEELNPDVKGHWIEESAEQLLQNNVKMLKSFSLVIACDLPEKTMLDLESFLWANRIPFVICRAYGLAGYVRLVHHDHIVIESHPDNPMPDFRLEDPWPELRQFEESLDLESMNHQEHSHVPYAVLLMKLVREWSTSLDTETGKPRGYPKKYPEKKAFRQFLMSRRMPDDKGSVEEENFQEAANALNRALVPYEIPSSVSDILNHPEFCDPKLSPHSSLSSKQTDEDVQNSHFWIIARAIRLFLDREGGGKYLPLSGSLPDMISDSDRYVKLSHIYRAKAAQDSDSVFGYVVEICNGLGMADGVISREKVKFFCRHAMEIRLVKGKCLTDEYVPETASKDVIQAGLEQEDAQMYLYILLRAADRFRMEMNRYPGTNGIPIDLDKNDLRNRVVRFLASLGLSDESLVGDTFQSYLEEVCRYGACELHTTAAFLGGVAAQEIIKMLTTQYVPLDNTWVFNGVTGSSSSYLM